MNRKSKPHKITKKPTRKSSKSGSTPKTTDESHTEIGHWRTMARNKGV